MRLKAMGAALLLFLLPILLLWKLTIAGRILVGLDPFNFFYPYHDAVAIALGEGRLPEWNPFLFGGVPFLADSQAQLFYPLAWPFLLLDAPTALTWSIALHLGIAGLGTFVWARWGLGIGGWGSLVAGLLFSAGGYLGAQVEHVNQVQAAAWLPWLLLGYQWTLPWPEGSHAEQGSRRRRAGVVVGALALALSFLAGHTQTTYISLFLLGLWVLRSLIAGYRRVREMLLTVHRGGLYTNVGPAAWLSHLVPVLLPLLLIGLIGGLLAAVQLAPTQALSTLSLRAGGLTAREAVSFSLDPRVFPRALLPTYGVDIPLLSEYVGWIGFAGLTLAGVASLRPRWADTAALRQARLFGLLAAGAGLFLAVGGYNPIYWLLVRVVPGFDLFRAPARWLLLWSLGASLLAGTGLEMLKAIRPSSGPGFPARGRALVAVLAAEARRRETWLFLLGATMFLVVMLLFGAWPPLRVLPLWLLATAATVLALALAWFWPRSAPVPHAALPVGLILLDLWAGWQGLAVQQATAPEAYSGLRPVPAHLLTVQPPAGAPRLLSLSDLTWDPGDLATIEARHAGLLGEEAIYDLVVATKLKEVLAPNQPMRWQLLTADGYGGGLLPSARWVTFQGTLPLARVVPDGRLREQLQGIPRASLLDVMGVEWLVADKVLDWWDEGIYHDLGAPITLDGGATAQWESRIEEATALSLVVIGEWPEEPGSVTVGSRRMDLGEAVERATRETPRGIERHLWLPLDPPVALDGIRLESRSRWTLGALTLVDERLPGFEPLPADPALRTTFSGDVKVYRRTQGAGRAWLVPSAVAVASPEEATAWLGQSTFDARATVLVEGQEGSPMLPEGGTGTVRWIEEAAERIVLQVNAPEGGWLVLADAPFPGWRATVDGEETEWHAANIINRALYLPPGEHLVEWRYRAPGLLLGGAGSVMGLLLLVGWSLFERQR